MKRRKFIQYSAAGVALAASASTLSGAEHITMKQAAGIEELDIRSETDVLVVGGGTAGSVAAIQAARAGAKTFLLNRGSQLGGTTTTGGVAFPGLFHAWGKQIISGIGWELVVDTVFLDGGSLPDFSVEINNTNVRHWRHQVHVNQFLYAILAEEKCEKAGVEIAYYESPQTIAKTDQGWQVDCTGFGTRRRIFCKQIIDCTGGAEVVGLLKLPRLREEETQPGSMLFQLDKANNPGRKNGPGAGTLNALYVHGANSANSRTVTAANLTGRKAVLEKVRKEKKRLMHLQPETAFRESFRIQGETVITLEDYTSGRIFDDAVCYAFYPVDLHTKDGVSPQPLAKGRVPTIPLSALIPEGSRNIIVAGRCVSSDRLANSGLRVQAPCMAMGQAAGATVALAVRMKTTPLKVPLNDIREMLVKNGAIVPNV
ncbi:MAG TPA: FAD-dependent oxidoreductase [Bacteroides sp.]|nr:FAD-dependent oxidoreductase [Bacteroides sp.]